MHNDQRFRFWLKIGLICLAMMLVFAGCASKNDTRRPPVKPVTEEDLPPQKVKPDHLALARQLMAKGYYDVALVQLKEKEEKDGKTAETRFFTGVCEREEGDLWKAEDAFREAIRIDDEYASAYDGLGSTLFAQDRRNEALEALEHAVALNPGRANFQNNLGYAYLLENRLPEAEKYFRKSIALMPGYSLALNNLGFCLVRLGRDTEALKIFQQALSMAEAYNNLGVAYERSGDRLKALTCYKEALRESPDLAQARKNASRLEHDLVMPNTEATEPITVEPH